MYVARLRRVSVLLLKAAAVLEFALVLSVGVGTPRTAAQPAVSQPEALPSSSGLTAERGKATVVVVLDPNAASAELSLGELRRTIAGREASLVAHVVFVVDSGDFVPRELWTSAASIPGAHVLRDSGGTEAVRLAAKPGTTMLYAADRRLLFRGSLLELSPLLDRPTTDSGAPAPRKDAAHRRKGPLEDWVDAASTRNAHL